MSYDLLVLLRERPDQATYADFGASHAISVTGEVGSGVQLDREGAPVILADPPIQVAAAEVERLTGWRPPDDRWWAELHVPAAAGVGDRRLAHLLGRLLAARHDGHLHDPQARPEDA
jgi:hypothetical protein